jgi:protein O-GlcNAc transferase
MTPTQAHLFTRAIQAHQAGQWEQAEALYWQILAQAPDHADAHHLLGVLYSQQSRHAEAVRHLRRAVSLDERNPLFQHNLGEAWRRQGKLAQAEQSYRQALALAPELAEAHYNLANLLKLQDQLSQAIPHYQRAIELKPFYANAYYNLGNALLEQGQFQAAAAAYEGAINWQPQFAEAYNNLGIVLKGWDRLDEAIDHYKQAIRLKPNFADAYRNLGLARERQGQIEAAQQAGQRALALDPDNDLFRLHVETLAPVIPASNEAIDQYRAGLSAILDRQLQADLHLDLSQLHTSGGEPPFVLAYQGRDDRPLKEKYGRLFQGRFPDLGHKVSRDKPHLGFVVTHGHEGVFLKCMRGILNHLSAERFSLTVVCSHPAGEPILRPAITNPAVQYLPLPPRFDQATELIRQAQFDLLHYWEVGTDTTNYFLPFCRLAPVQCATWGWPVTTGIPTMDYFISAELLETAESDDHYSETLVRLKRLPTYYYRPPVPAARPPRAYFGLAEAQRLYLCVQNLRKIHPDFDALLAQILRRDAKGLLLLIEDQQPFVTELLRRRLWQTMPDVAERVRFMPRMSETDYLNLTALVDVVLDTLYYGGGANTTYDAFAAGTPVVTLPTQFHRGRYTYAAYRQMGCLDGVADSAEAYVGLALRLGTDPASRAEVSANISAACPSLFEDRAPVTELADFFEQALVRAREA